MTIEIATDFYEEAKIIQNDLINLKLFCQNQEVDPSAKLLLEKRDSLLSNIDDFWSRVLYNHPVINSYISPIDFEVFSLLDKLEVFKDAHTTILRFYFDNNAIFLNKYLERRFDEIENTCTATRINWILPTDAFLVQTPLIQLLFDDNFSNSVISHDLFDIVTSEIYDDPFQWID
eukprot:TRINITY_DN493_c0_g1_i1.p1 TRINITY_DN493_c0_g1~~TRINITY_DN493_c0_g1_i1.p1  ORF type:complete len:175 (-),score=38.16 TRINITY_DN493_c0_g1_i1:293-817(-)